MRVAVNRQAIRSAREHRVERARESGDRLLRQAVDQIDIDRTEAVGSARVDGAPRFFYALHAVHRALHFRIEVLHAQARAVEPDARVLSYVACLDLARIKLDREIALGAAAESEVVAYGLQQHAEVGRPHEVRRAAAEVYLHDFAIVIEQRAVHRDFALQALEVGTRTTDVARDDAIAAAVEAGTEAEWHVHVQRQLARQRPGVAVRDVLAKHFLGEFRIEVRRRGI